MPSNIEVFNIQQCNASDVNIIAQQIYGGASKKTGKRKKEKYVD